MFSLRTRRQPHQDLPSPWRVVIPGLGITATQRYDAILAADETDDFDVATSYEDGFELACYGNRNDLRIGWTVLAPDMTGWTAGRCAAYLEGFVHGTAIRTAGLS